MMEFRTLNNFARAQGEGLREKVNLAIPDSILEGDREACPFEGAGAAADPYRKDPLSLSLETSLL